MDTSASPASATFRPGRYWTFIGLLCSTALGMSYFVHRQLSALYPVANSLPVLAHVEHDCEATERSGAIVHLSSLRGKVSAVAYIYTVCPHGCAVVTGEMLKLKKQFGKNPDFQLVSVSVAPERDTAPFLQSYAQGIGLSSSDPWWFVTGDRQKLSGFMTNELNLAEPRPIPESERLNPLDLYQHDLRVVLVDRNGNVRGYYDVFHPQPEIASIYTERLPKDIKKLLDNPGA